MSNQNELDWSDLSNYDNTSYHNTIDRSDYDTLGREGTYFQYGEDVVGSIVLVHQSNAYIGFIDTETISIDTNAKVHGYYVVSNDQAKVFRPTGPLSFSYGSGESTAYITYGYILWTSVIGHYIKIRLDNLSDIDLYNSSDSLIPEDVPSVSFVKHSTANMYLSRYLFYPTAARISFSASTLPQAINGYVDIDYNAYDPKIGTPIQTFQEGYVANDVNYTRISGSHFVIGSDPVHIFFTGSPFVPDNSGDLAWTSVQTLGSATDMNTLESHTLCFPIFLSNPALHLETWFDNPDDFCGSSYMRPYLRAQNITTFETRTQVNLPIDLGAFGFNYTLVGLMGSIGRPRSGPSIENFYDPQYTDKKAVTSYLGYNNTEFYTASVYKYFVYYGTNENHYITMRSDHGLLTVQFSGEHTLLTPYQAYDMQGQPYFDTMFYKFNAVTPEEYFYADAFIWAKHQFKYDTYQVYNHPDRMYNKVYGPANQSTASNIVMGAFNVHIPTEKLQSACSFSLDENDKIMIDSPPLTGNNVHIVGTMNQSLDMYDSWDPPEGRNWIGSMYASHDHVSADGSMASFHMIEQDSKILTGVSTEYGVLDKIYDIFIAYTLRDIDGANPSSYKNDILQYLHDEENKNNFTFSMYSVISMLDDWDETLANMCISPQSIKKQTGTLPETHWLMGFNEARTNLFTKYYANTDRTMSYLGIRSTVTVSVGSNFSVYLEENATYSVIGVPFGTNTACWAVLKITPPGTDAISRIVPLRITHLNIETSIEDTFVISIEPNVGIVTKIQQYKNGIFVYDDTQIHLIGIEGVTDTGRILSSVELNTGNDHIYIDRFDILLSGGIGDKLLDLYYRNI